MAALELIQIPVWNDNYVYLLGHGNLVLVVDPPEAGPVLDALTQRPGAQLVAVLNTHHHGDHTGGNAELVDATGCQVVGPARDAKRFPSLTLGAKIGQTLNLAGLEIRVLDVAAHTLSHVAYAIDQKADLVVRHGHAGQAQVMATLAHRPLLFVGDSLFTGGCGRLFEGTPKHLHASLATLAAENPNALIACAHEYTRSNLAFAAAVLPNHVPIAERLAALDDEVSETGSSVPSTLEQELQTNPFLLALSSSDQEELRQQLGVPNASEVELVGALRRAKDNF